MNRILWVIRVLLLSFTIHCGNTDVDVGKRSLIVGSLCSDVSFSCECFKYSSDVSHLPVVDINCSYMNLAAVTLEMTVPEFTETLDFSDNRITNITNNSCLKSVTMIKLFLNNNLINDIAISSFDELPNLEELDLSDNEITTLSAGIFHGIYKLKILNLASNKLQTLPQYTFQYLPILTSLNIDNNDLGPFLMHNENMFGPTGLSVNPRLVSLFMTNINITNVPAGFFKPSYNLRELSLARNHIEIFPELPFTLEVLDISSNQISTLKPLDFINLPGIQKLVLNHLPNLREIGNHTFHSTRNLKQLIIENCKHLKYFSPYAFGVNVVSDDGRSYEFTLEKLSLLGSGLDTLDSRLLPIFSRLSILDLRGNPWRCDCNIKWMLELKVQEEMKEFISCFRPYKVAGRLLWSLDPDKEMPCRFHATVIQYVTSVALVFMCIALAALATWLVLLWPRNKVNPRIVGAHSSYEPVTLNITNGE